MGGGLFYLRNNSIITHKGGQLKDLVEQLEELRIAMNRAEESAHASLDGLNVGMTVAHRDILSHIDEIESTARRNAGEVARKLISLARHFGIAPSDELRDRTQSQIPPAIPESVEMPRFVSGAAGHRALHALGTGKVN